MNNLLVDEILPELHKKSVRRELMFLAECIITTPT